jgi:hypothetical protein
MRQPTLLFILKGEMDWHRKQQTCALEAQFNRPLRSLSLQIDLYLGRIAGLLYGSPCTDKGITANVNDPELSPEVHLTNK